MPIPVLNRIGLYAQGLEIITGTLVDEVKRISPDLVVVLNKRSMRPSVDAQGRQDPGWRYEIYDRSAPGGLKWQLVMRVQEPDASFRPLDGRVLVTLLEARGRSVDELLDRIEAQEEARERQTDKKSRALAEDMYEIVWALGKRVHGYGGNNVVWQQRTDAGARERIRQAAGLV